MAGAHRLTAARELGWETIKVTCWTCTDDFARLMEIDDNLAGAELTALLQEGAQRAERAAGLPAPNIADIELRNEGGSWGEVNVTTFSLPSVQSPYVALAIFHRETPGRGSYICAFCASCCTDVQASTL